jgi:hypothetical protein
MKKLQEKVVLERKRIPTGKHPDEDIMAAYIIFRASGLENASRETGIHKSVLRRRFTSMRLVEKDTKKPSKVEVELQQKAVDMAVERASYYLSDRVISLANALFDTAEEAVKKTRKMVVSDKKNQDAPWLKALVNTWQVAIQSGQLLSNKPTSREELNVRSENPENLTDDQLIDVIQVGKASLNRN